MTDMHIIDVIKDMAAQLYPDFEICDDSFEAARRWMNEEIKSCDAPEPSSTAEFINSGYVLYW